MKLLVTKEELTELAQILKEYRLRLLKELGHLTAEGIKSRVDTYMTVKGILKEAGCKVD
jgi:hypothetical protein